MLCDPEISLRYFHETSPFSTLASIYCGSIENFSSAVLCGHLLLDYVTGFAWLKLLLIFWILFIFFSKLSTGLSQVHRTLWVSVEGAQPEKVLFSVQPIYIFFSYQAKPVEIFLCLEKCANLIT